MTIGSPGKWGLSAAMLASALMAAPAFAGNLTVRVTDTGGHPATDAVVTLIPAKGTPPRPRVESGYRVIQQGTQFKPFVSVVPVGATVAFPNLDPFRHHVYSFSKARRFELKLFARDQTRSVTFDKPGIVAIGCNIHDSMSAYIFVADSVWTQRVTASGTVRFADIPEGSFTMQIWQPYLRAPGGIVSRSLILRGGDNRESVTVALRSPPMHSMGGY